MSLGIDPKKDMLQNWWPGRVLMRALIVAIVLASAAVIVVFSVGLTIAIRSGISNEAWIAIATAVYSFFTCLVFLVLALAAWPAWHQLKEATRARFLQAVNEIYRYLDSREGRTARDYVYWAQPAELTGPEADTDKIRTVANTFEHIGLLAEHSLVAKSIILDYFWELTLEMWSRLNPYVEATRKWRGKQYADHFETLASDAEKYRKRKYPHHRVGTRPTPP